MTDGQFDSSTVLKMHFSKREETPFLAAFNIIISHIFPESFRETPEVVQKT